MSDTNQNIGQRREGAESDALDIKQSSKSLKRSGAAGDPGARKLSESDWRSRLTPEEFEVTRRAGTERPFTSPLLDNHADGSYRCVGCGAELFESGTKFESGSGWPSFTAPASRERVELMEDRSHGMVRTEVRCRNCGSHLGHVFPDGPGPGGERYCINGVALDFQSDPE